MKQVNRDAIAFRQDFPSLHVPQDELVEFKKTMSEYWKEANKEARPDNCLICGKPISGICNSHTVPQYCLRAIAKDGLLYTTAALMNTNLIDNEIGLKEAATFKQICRKCDTEFFKLYETPATLQQQPTSKVLGQIAAKNLLREISKGRRELGLKKAFGEKTTPEYDAMMYVRAIDVEEDERAFKTAVRVAKASSSSRAYRLIFYRVLPYVAPIAFQQMISLVSDFQGEIINNVYNPNPRYRIEPIHVCVFPSKESTVVLIFRAEKANRYRSFERQLRSLDDNSQLLAILKLIFAYSEDVIISKHLSEDTIHNDALSALAQMNHNYYGFGNTIDDYKATAQEKAVYDFAIDNLPEPPNLLSASYSI